MKFRTVRSAAAILAIGALAACGGGDGGSTEPTSAVTAAPTTAAPTTPAPTEAPTTPAPTEAPTTPAPTEPPPTEPVDTEPVDTEADQAPTGAFTLEAITEAMVPATAEGLGLELTPEQTTCIGQGIFDNVPQSDLEGMGSSPSSEQTLMILNEFEACGADVSSFIKAIELSETIGTDADGDLEVASIDELRELFVEFGGVLEAGTPEQMNCLVDALVEEFGEQELIDMMNDETTEEQDVIAEELGVECGVAPEFFES